MATATLPRHNGLGNQFISPACENCLHWHLDSQAPAYARQGNSFISVIAVGQCSGYDQGQEEAPGVEIDSGIAFVFTTASGSCPAFEPTPELVAEYYVCSAEFQHDIAMDR